jgi:hypothetical protein
MVSLGTYFLYLYTTFMLPDIYLGCNILATNEKVCKADFQHYLSRIFYGLL